MIVLSVRAGVGNYFRPRATLFLYLCLASLILVKKSKSKLRKKAFVGRMWPVVRNCPLLCKSFNFSHRISLSTSFVLGTRLILTTWQNKSFELTQIFVNLTYSSTIAFFICKNTFKASARRQDDDQLFLWSLFWKTISVSALTFFIHF